jgi:hypothetical protein
MIKKAAAAIAIGGGPGDGADGHGKYRQTAENDRHVRDGLDDAVIRL